MMEDDQIEVSSLLLARELFQGLRHSMRSNVDTLKILLFALEKTLRTHKEASKDSDQFDEIFEAMRSAISSISSDIDSTSRIFNTQREQLKEINLFELLTKASSEISEILSRQDVNVVIKGNKSIYMNGSEEHIKYAIIQIIINSLEAYKQVARKSNRVVRIAIRREGDHALIDISDNAGGVPSSISEKIFEPGYTTKKNGTGLGLAIVRRILQRHRGSIELLNSRASGTTLRITIPIYINESSNG